ncbi:MAG: flavin reductase family protein [Gemmatimonadetes bacterium]|nr:flavin reductase family protein [Gemmatimonadota bacterium]
MTGVAIVAARRADGQPCGLTANAFTSLSLDPPLVLVCVERQADSHDCIRDAGVFSVNVLASGDSALARRFALSGGAEKFAGLELHTAITGAPILSHAIAWVDCRLQARHPGGDHSIFVGEVLDGGAADGDPLVFYRGDYEGLHR